MIYFETYMMVFAGCMLLAGYCIAKQHRLYAFLLIVMGLFVRWYG